MPRVSAVLERVLTRERARYNALFRVYGRGVDPAAALGFLARSVDAVVGALPEADAAAACEPLFELGLRALVRGLATGSDTPTALERALAAKLPRFGAALGREPRRVLAAIGNGYLRLERELGARAALTWLDAWSAVAPVCPRGEALFDAGLVLAWRVGLCEARAAALARVAAMSAELRELLLGARDIDSALERRFAALGSRAPLAPPSVVARVGGFIGFGGPFARPPAVFGLDERIYASDGEVVRELVADVFGARLVATPLADAEVRARASTDRVLLVGGDGALGWGDERVMLPELVGATSGAHAPGLAAVALATSHALCVVGRKERSTAA